MLAGPELYNDNDVLTNITFIINQVKNESNYAYLMFEGLQSSVTKYSNDIHVFFRQYFLEVKIYDK